MVGIRTKSRDTGQNVHVPVHHGDGHPKIFPREEKLLLERNRVVSGQLYHSEFRSLCGRLFVPVERRLGWMRPGQLLHPIVGLLVEFDLETEGFGYGLVRDIVVSESSSLVRKAVLSTSERHTS